MRKLSKKLEKFESYETDTDGARLIRLHVHDDNFFLSPLSVQGVPAISDETAYLLNYYLKNMSVDSDEKLRFEIYAHDISQSEQILYRKAITNYYKEEFVDVEEQLKNNRKDAFTSFLIGIFIFGVKILIDSLFNSPAAASAIDVLSWFFIWDSIDVFFFKRDDLRVKQLQNLKVLEAEITFKQL